MPRVTYGPRKRGRPTAIIKSGVARVWLYGRRGWLGTGAFRKTPTQKNSLGTGLYRVPLLPTLHY